MDLETWAETVRSSKVSNGGSLFVLFIALVFFGAIGVVVVYAAFDELNTLLDSSFLVYVLIATAGGSAGWLIVRRVRRCGDNSSVSTTLTIAEERARYGVVQKKIQRQNPSQRRR